MSHPVAIPQPSAPALADPLEDLPQYTPGASAAYSPAQPYAPLPPQHYGPAPYPQPWAAPQAARPPRKPIPWKPVLLIGGMLFGIYLVLCGAGGLIFLGGRWHQSAGYAEHAVNGTSPLAAFRAQAQYHANRRWAALYYYHDTESRKFLDEIAQKYGLADGVELIASLYEPGDVVEINEEAKARWQELAERLANDYQLSEEVDGNRGAVIVEAKKWSMKYKVPMVRETGIWHHPLSRPERDFFAAAAAKFRQRR